MIALTQEKREELIQYAKFTSAQYDHDEELCEIMEIALASLTAESVAWVFDDDLQDLKNGYMGSLSATNVDPNIDIPIHRLYIAPPVPDIKLPSDSDFDSWFKSIEAGDYGDWQEPAYQSVEWYQYLSRRQLAKGAFNFYADELKRLNGLGE